MTQTGARTHTWGGDTVHRNTALGSEGRSEPAFVCGDMCVCVWVGVLGGGYCPQYHIWEVSKKEQTEDGDLLRHQGVFLERKSSTRALELRSSWR